MSRHPRPSDALVVFWIALAASPVLVLTRAEYRPAGSTPGWHFASLAPGGALRAWTQHRLAAWLVVYAVGFALLLVARRRDHYDAKLGEFAGTLPALLAPAYAGVVLLALASVLHASETVIVAMAGAGSFFALWIVRRTGRALADTVARLMLATGIVAVFAATGEVVMRAPAVVERTGGSREMRAAHRDEWERRLFGAGWDGVPRWRTRHEVRAKPDGVFRVLALGDSFSYGEFIDRADDLWPAVLEDTLKARGLAVEAVNAAAGGSDSVGEQAVLATVGWGYAPDLVVVQYTLNDAGGDPLERAFSALPVVGASLSAKSSLFHFVDLQFRAAQAALLHPDGWSSLFAEDAPGWRRSRGALQAIARDAAARGVPVVLMLFPMFDSDLRVPGYRNVEAHRAIESFARELGVPLLDLREPLARVDPRPRAWWVRPFDAHPSAPAHRVAGEALAAELMRLGVLPPPVPEARRAHRGAR